MAFKRAFLFVITTAPCTRLIERSARMPCSLLMSTMRSGIFRGGDSFKVTAGWQTELPEWAVLGSR